MTSRSTWVAAPQSRAALILLFAVVSAINLRAQEPLPEGISLPNYEASSYDTLMERTDLGNVAQQARQQYSTGVRDLNKARKLQEKAATTVDADERTKLKKKEQRAIESAERAFREAVSFAPGLIEAYAGLGTALRLQGKTEEALQVHAMALRRAPDDLENFAGWADSLLSLNMLGNATSAYSQYVETNPARAEILMTAIENWLALRKADPGDIDAADLQRLVDWVAQQKEG